MQWTEIALNILFTMVFMWLIAWTLFAWGFGVTNFKQKHGRFLGFIGFSFWYFLLAAHVVAIVVLWVSVVSIYWPIAMLIVSHVSFGLVFGRNVSTR
ncbi:hypothetical protein [Reinekea sp.]|jgi:hypothetical protein|uniref:hypothetical protein n=1 Tax=Reinekea sp. TaxID=1970455 RepID=UPI0039891191